MSHKSVPPHQCQIYALFDENGCVNYVGRTARHIRFRLNEHRQVLGFTPAYQIIDRCTENCDLVEKAWIEHYRDRGCKLRNIAYGQGPHFLSEAARAKLSGPKGPRGPEVSERMSVAQKLRWSRYTPEKREAVQAALKRGQKKVPKEVRECIGRMGAERQREIWTPEQRRARAAKISATLRANPEPCSAGGKKAVSNQPPDHMQRMNEGVQEFWSELRADPERYREYLKNRGASISKAKKAAPDSWPERDAATGRFKKRNPKDDA